MNRFLTASVVQQVFLLCMLGAGVSERGLQRTTIVQRVAPGPGAGTYTLRSMVAGDDDKRIVRIEVYSAEHKEPLQVLKECQMEEPLSYADRQPLRLEDLNFDGYKDLLMLQSRGATGNEFYCIWTFDPADKKFHFNKEFSRLIGNHELHQESKQIVTTSNGGGGQYQRETYAVRDGSLILVADERQELDKGNCPMHKVEHQRRNGALVVTSEEWLNSDGTKCKR